MKITNRAARRYLREVRSLLPAGRMKRRITEQITCCVSDFLEQEPDADAAALQARFGPPQAIAAAFIESLGTAELLQRLKLRRRITTAVVAGLLTVLFVWAAFITWSVVKVNQTYDTPRCEFNIK